MILHGSQYNKPNRLFLNSDIRLLLIVLTRADFVANTRLWRKQLVVLACVERLPTKPDRLVDGLAKTQNSGSNSFSREMMTEKLGQNCRLFCKCCRCHRRERERELNSVKAAAHLKIALTWNNQLYLNRQVEKILIFISIRALLSQLISENLSLLSTWLAAIKQKSTKRATSRVAKTATTVDATSCYFEFNLNLYFTRKSE